MWNKEKQQLYLCGLINSKQVICKRPTTVQNRQNVSFTIFYKKKNLKLGLFKIHLWSRCIHKMVTIWQRIMQIQNCCNIFFFFFTFKGCSCHKILLKCINIMKRDLWKTALYSCITLCIVSLTTSSNRSIKHLIRNHPAIFEPLYRAIVHKNEFTSSHIEHVDVGRLLIKQKCVEINLRKNNECYLIRKLQILKFPIVISVSTLY